MIKYGSIRFLKVFALGLLVFFGRIQSPLYAHPQPMSLQGFQKKPKLVVVMVVDQFRSDYLTRFSKRFLPARAKDGSPGGYQYLMSSGAYIPFAQYDVLQCMTGPGHAMILSGSYPYQTGIPLNYWFDHQSGKSFYCVQDLSHPLVGAEEGTKKTEVGMSPKNFTANTVGDELKNAGYPSKVVAVALKDRAAILLGGHRADLALWFDPRSYRWVSSNFYLPDARLPDWVIKLNQEISSLKGKPYDFKASQELATGLASMNDSFQHLTTVGTKEILSYPFGLDLTVQAAERALESFRLGRGKATDLLAVSFSSHDYLAHRYGPNAAELEEMTVAGDRAISRFLKTLQKKVPGGLKDVLLVLTADHGGPPHPTALPSGRMNFGRIHESDAIKRMNERLDAKFGHPKTGNWVIFSGDLNFFLSNQALAEKEISREKIEDEAKAELMQMAGVQYVFSRTDYEKRRLPPGIFGRQAMKTYIPEKSGDLVVIPKPFFMESDPQDALSHQTGYTYDRTVPLILVGSRIRRGVYSAHVDVIDLAPTLSFLLGVLPPSTSEGRVLSEILADP